MIIHNEHSLTEHTKLQLKGRKDSFSLFLKTICLGLLLCDCKYILLFTPHEAVDKEQLLFLKVPLFCFFITWWCKALALYSIFNKEGRYIYQVRGHICINSLLTMRASTVWQLEHGREACERSI